MKKNEDPTAVLPDGRRFEFWEEDCVYSRVLYVDGNSTAASDENDGSRESSGWYKLKEHEVINGYGIYCEGTDRLIVAHNLNSDT